jgi:hypothetical protein
VPSGRPKTASGHRDDAMLEFLEFQGLVNTQIEMEQRHYRERRDHLNQMAERLRQGALSLAYADVVERHAMEGPVAL